MDVERFSARAPGRLVSASDGASAFVPAPLPAAKDVLNRDVVLRLSAADSILGRLDGTARHLPDPEILIGPFLRREAVLSSRIEGTQTTYTKLVLLEAEAEALTRDSQEVRNYVDALRYAIKRVDEVGFSRTLLFETHELLMQGTDERRTLPGRYRDREVFIGAPGLGIADARYVPPPSPDVEPLMSNLLDYISNDDALPLLVRLAIAHYQFEAVHPFADGNGRMGRLLMIVALYRARRIIAPMLYLSAYFERRRETYNDLMLDVSRDAQWEPWIAFFLDAVATQAADAIERTAQLQALRERYRDVVSGPRRSITLLSLVDALFEFPVIWNQRAARIMKVSEQSAAKAIERLAHANIIERVEMRGRRHVYLARDIIEVVDRAEAVPKASTS